MDHTFSKYDKDAFWQYADEVNATLPVFKWESNRYEDQTTHALWQVCASNRKIKEGVVQALMVNAPQNMQTQLATQNLHAFDFSSTTGPDLAFVNDNNEVCLVIEHKQGAAAQVPAVASYRNKTPWLGSGTVGLEVVQNVIEPAVDEPHDPDLCETCEYHTQPRRGLVRGGIYQIDAYRCFDSWLDGVTDQDDVAVHLTDSSNAVWVVWDRYGREVSHIFEDAYTSHMWVNADYVEFSKELLRLREEATENKWFDAVVAINKLLWMMTTRETF